MNESTQVGRTAKEVDEMLRGVLAQLTAAHIRLIDYWPAASGSIMSDVEAQLHYELTEAGAALRRVQKMLWAEAARLKQEEQP